MQHKIENQIAPLMEMLHSKIMSSSNETELMESEELSDLTVDKIREIPQKHLPLDSKLYESLKINLIPDFKELTYETSSKEKLAIHFNYLLHRICEPK